LSSPESLSLAGSVQLGLDEYPPGEPRYRPTAVKVRTKSGNWGCSNITLPRSTRRFFRPVPTTLELRNPTTSGRSDVSPYEDSVRLHPLVYLPSVRFLQVEHEPFPSTASASFSALCRSKMLQISDCTHAHRAPTLNAVYGVAQFTQVNFEINLLYLQYITYRKILRLRQLCRSLT